ncbi:MAG TPA: DnaJ domain-containing protein [Dokdonella sp.]|uniref:J domain-containing protein n=1 Tax=Dokdonella sp. TaxID=2291710 RepID=UPI002C17CB98|nr:DnaJ domain-containing protein [Dokdonella sp.]HUD42961.1 DnaJ domain-containing protein [Dokdonella sp.]
MRPAGDALDLALALLRAPGLRATLQARPLPDGLGDLLAVAASADGATHSAEARELRAAARFFVEQILFADDTDAYRILGVPRDAEPALIRRHYRLLASWLHPDRAAAGAAVFSSTLNVAFARLRTDQARAAYDAQLERRRSSLPVLAGGALPPHADPAHPAVWPRRSGPGGSALPRRRAIRERSAAGSPSPALLRQHSAPPEESAQLWRTRPLGGTGLRTLAAGAVMLCAALIWIDTLRTVPIDADPGSAPPAHRQLTDVAFAVPSGTTAPAPSADAPVPAAAAVEAPAMAAPEPAALAGAPGGAASAAPPIGAGPPPSRAPTSRPATSLSEPGPARSIATAATPPSAPPAAIVAAERTAAPARAETPDAAQASRRVQRAMRYLLESDAPPPPIWNAPDVVDEAVRIRSALQGRLSGSAARFELEAPHWTVVPDQAVLHGGYRIAADTGTLETGRIRIELVWREHQWLISALQMEP